jgi:hypothetical protein
VVLEALEYQTPIELVQPRHMLAVVEEVFTGNGPAAVVPTAAEVVGKAAEEVLVLQIAVVVAVVLDTLALAVAAEVE